MQETLKTREQLVDEIAELRARLEEPEQTVGAIRRGEVDAFVVLEAGGEQVYTLGTAELLLQLQVITDSLPVLVGYLDRDRRYRFVNRLYESWFGRSVHEIVGREVAEVVGEAAYASLRGHIDQVLSGRQASFERWLDLRDAGHRCVQVTLIPHLHDGEVQGYVSFVQDMTERRRAEEALRLLADAGQLLAGAPGSETILADAARLAVPALADRCAIELAKGDGEAGGAAGAAGAGGSTGEVAPSSRLDVPLEVRGRTLGEWSFVYAESGRRHAPEDVEVARELARRVAAALDNSRLYRELETANRAKDRFLATLSHELRTPLAPVLATASRLAVREDLPAEVAAGIELIHRNVELEARLIDDLLDLTRISRGRLELHAALIDVRRVIAQALETCDERARATRQVVLDPAAETHVVWGDPVRLVQVFWNLLSNALKFTPEGGTIRLRTSNETAIGGGPGAAEAGAERTAPRELVVAISDSGMGVEAEAIGHIFDAFDQGGAVTGRRYGGLGLGLAISRAIVEVHGGRLTATSGGRDAGATFTVRLPLPEAAGAAAPREGIAVGGAATGADAGAATGAGAGAGAPTGAAAGAAGGAAAGAGAGTGAAVSPPTGPAGAAAVAGMHILLVEDHADTAEAMAELLRVIGHRVTVTGSVAATLALVRSGEAGTIDLVISDLGLPDGEGHELMEVLAGRHGLRGIALSGYGMESDLAKSRAAGFDLHLIKPVDLATLRDAIQRLAVGADGRPAGGADGQDRR